METNKGPRMRARLIKASGQHVVSKSSNCEQIDNAEPGIWIAKPFSMLGLKEMVSSSSILPQCITAYSNNIAGFGIGIRYIDDVAETDEMATEYTRAEELIELLSYDGDTKEVFEKVIAARETYGIAYLEVIRNIAGEVVQVDFIHDIPSIDKSKQLDPYIDINFYFRGKPHLRHKKFRKYRQSVNGKTVYFKEFGDPRVMNKVTGEYVKPGETLPIDEQANEIIDFTVGTAPYGEVRWVGQMLGIDGGRRAENLNNRYFKKGRHTPLMLLIKGGTLTDDSYNKLTEYMNDIEGENGQHSFLLIETEKADNTTDFEGGNVDIDVKNIASVLQQDELFQQYIENTRKRIQSAFRLPDLYVGYTTDFNRATAQTAQEITEKQVFQPERKSLAWLINNKLLNEYGFQHIEFYFKEPDTKNPDDIYKLASIAERAGGLTPNKAKEIIHTALGENYEPFDGEWGDIPIPVSQMLNVQAQEDSQILKSDNTGNDELVAVMKEVRNVLKNNFTHPMSDAIMKGHWVTINGNRVFIADQPSPSGANSLDIKGFPNKQKLNNHWKNGRTHQDEYVRNGITTAEQYQARAVELLESPVGGDIHGHITADNIIVRYDAAKNDFVKGTIERGVITMFKPIIGKAYYDEQAEEDIKHGGKK